jgi:hypothetical protein
MAEYVRKVCDCGSEKLSFWRYDARGIPLVRTCSDCFDERVTKRYRKEVLDNPNYYADEPIEDNG